MGGVGDKPDFIAEPAPLPVQTEEKKSVPPAQKPAPQAKPPRWPKSGAPVARQRDHFKAGGVAVVSSAAALDGARAELDRLAARVGRPMVSMPREELGWPERTLAAVHTGAAYQGLSPEGRQQFDRVWGSFGRFQQDGRSAAAAKNLLSALTSGRLASPEGRQLLSGLAAAVSTDGQPDHPATSDAVLLLSKPAALDRSLQTGSLRPGVSRPEQVRAIASEVCKDVRGALTSNNSAIGLMKETGLRTANQVAGWVGWDRIPDDRIGVEGTRTAAGEAGSLGDGTAPDTRQIEADNASKLALVARTNGWGNCQECASATATSLHNRGVVGVEIMHRPGVGPTASGNHAFVVVGRDPRSDPGNPATWGPNALIVDAWAGASEVYPASEAMHRLPGKGPIQSHFRLPDN
jgi:hypothetical protein